MHRNVVRHGRDALKTTMRPGATLFSREEEYLIREAANQL